MRARRSALRNTAAQLTLLPFLTVLYADEPHAVCRISSVAPTDWLFGSVMGKQTHGCVPGCIRLRLLSWGSVFGTLIRKRAFSLQGTPLERRWPARSARTEYLLQPEKAKRFLILFSLAAEVSPCRLEKLRRTNQVTRKKKKKDKKENKTPDIFPSKP